MKVLKWLDRPYSKFETWFWHGGNPKMKVLKWLNRPFSKFETRFWNGMCAVAAVAGVAVLEILPIT